MAYNLSKEYQVRSKKPVKKHKQTRKKKVPTPIPLGEKVCACGCGKKHNLSIHHVFFNRGSRDLSSIHHCVEWLCWHSHQSSTGIHGTHSDGELDKKLKRKHQLRLMNNGMSLDEFIKLFGRSYVGM